MTHEELINKGYTWLMSHGCAFAFKELVTMSGFGEIPDVIGFNSDGTFLLEAKTTRSDFIKDRQKMFRKNPEFGMGDWRFFICEAGLIKVDELPDMWGLIEVNRKGRARIKHNPFGKGNIYSHWKRNKKYERSEKQMMYSALRRLQLRGRIKEIYKL